MEDGMGGRWDGWKMGWRGMEGWKMGWMEDGMGRDGRVEDGKGRRVEEGRVFLSEPGFSGFQDYQNKNV